MLREDEKILKILCCNSPEAPQGVFSRPLGSISARNTGPRGYSPFKRAMPSAEELDAATAEVAFDFEKQAAEMRTYWDQPLARYDVELKFNDIGILKYMIAQKDY